MPTTAFSPKRRHYLDLVNEDLSCMCPMPMHPTPPFPPSPFSCTSPAPCLNNSRINYSCSTNARQRGSESILTIVIKAADQKLILSQLGSLSSVSPGVV